MRLGSAGFMRQAFLWAFLPIVVLILTAPSVGDAQVPQTVTTSITSTTGTGDLGTIVTHQVGSHLSTSPEGRDQAMAPTSFTASEISLSGPEIQPTFSTTLGLRQLTSSSRVTNPETSHTSMAPFKPTASALVWQCEFVSDESVRHRLWATRLVECGWVGQLLHRTVPALVRRGQQREFLCQSRQRRSCPIVSLLWRLWRLWISVCRPPTGF